MKRLAAIVAAGFLIVVSLAGFLDGATAGNPEKIKAESKNAASDIKGAAAQTGKAFAKAGKEIKDGAVKTGAAAKGSFKNIGRDFKKACKETRDAFKKEFNGDKKD